MTQRFLFDFLEADRRRREAWLRLRSGDSVQNRRAAEPLAVNPYKGCRLGCAYCFARGSPQREKGVFEQAVGMKDGGLSRLRRAIAAAAGDGRPIAIGTATDPYQPLEKETRWTRRLLEELSVQSGLSVSLATKSCLIVRDSDLLREVARCNRLRVEISLMSLDDDLLRLLEPDAPPSGERLRTLRKLVAADVPAGIVLAPIIPGLNDSLAALESVTRAARLWRARFLDWMALTLPEGPRQTLPSRLAEVSKPLVERLERLYSGGDQAPVFSKRLIATRVRELKLKYDFNDPAPAVPREPSLDLPGLRSRAG